MTRVPGDATAYAHRQAELVFVTLSAGPALVVEAAGPALEATWDRLAPHIGGADAMGNLFTGNHNVRSDGA